MFEEITKNKKPVPEKLISYGFGNNGDYFQYSTEIYSGTFLLTIQIGADDTIKTDLIEKETGEAYILYKTNASGSYVGEIRAAVGQVIYDIVQKCYETAIFTMAQAQMTIKFVREQFGDELEFLWEKSPRNAIWRRKDNKKWYGAILTVSGKKIGLESDRIEEIIDLRMNPAEAETILARDHYYRGWHMNKKSWYTLVLDGSIPDEELKDQIRESYKLAGK